MLCKHYHWAPDFWRKMGRREFYAIVDETHTRLKQQTEQNPGSWENYTNDAWYQQARQKRERLQGRA